MTGEERRVGLVKSNFPREIEEESRWQSRCGGAIAGKVDSKNWQWKENSVGQNKET